MSSAMLLFLFTKSVDPYVNAITYAYDQKSITSVRLIHIKDAETSLTEQEAKELSENIWKQIEALAEGKYIDFFSERRVILSSNDSRFEVYKSLQEKIKKPQVSPVIYSELREGIQSLVNNFGGTKRCLLDITGGSKVPSIDIFSICLALDIQSLYSFELFDQVDRGKPENSLYHALASNQRSYTHITKRIAVEDSKKAILRKSELLWYVIFAALVVMGCSLWAFLAGGSQSFFLQVLNLIAAVVSLVTPVFAIVNQKRSK